MLTPSQVNWISKSTHQSAANQVFHVHSLRITVDYCLVLKNLNDSSWPILNKYEKQYNLVPSYTTGKQQWPNSTTAAGQCLTVLFKTVRKVLQVQLW